MRGSCRAFRGVSRGVFIGVFREVSRFWGVGVEWVEVEEVGVERVVAGFWLHRMLYRYVVHLFVIVVVFWVYRMDTNFVDV
jgi:hypothetical protein